jgi:peptidoglycan/xylan/chitin deacetylase (PgdA/CDA1 family)
MLLSCTPTGGAVEEDTEDITVGGDRPRVALTYDDGPHNVRTKEIVDELDKYGYHATFFVVGNRVDGSEYAGGDAMLYAIRHGNEVGIHGYTHTLYYDECSAGEYQEEINETRRAIREYKTGYRIKRMRPVGGKITEERVEASDYAVIMWDVDSEDWKHKYKNGDSDEVCREKVDTIVANVLDNVKDGSIILMHDLYESTYDATVIILAELHARGYDVVTVSELLGDGREAGKLYSSADDADE